MEKESGAGADTVIETITTRMKERRVICCERGVWMMGGVMGAAASGPAIPLIGVPINSVEWKSRVGDLGGPTQTSCQYFLPCPSWQETSAFAALVVPTAPADSHQNWSCTFHQLQIYPDTIV